MSWRCMGGVEIQHLSLSVLVIGTMLFKTVQWFVLFRFCSLGYFLRTLFSLLGEIRQCSFTESDYLPCCGKHKVSSRLTIATLTVLQISRKTCDTSIFERAVIWLIFYVFVKLLFPGTILWLLPTALSTGNITFIIWHHGFNSTCQIITLHFSYTWGVHVLRSPKFFSRGMEADRNVKVVGGDVAVL